MRLSTAEIGGWSRNGARCASVAIGTAMHRFVTEERGGVATIAGIAALTVAVLTAAGIVASVMMDHANAIPRPAAVVGGN